MEQRLSLDITATQRELTLAREALSNYPTAASEEGNALLSRAKMDERFAKIRWQTARCPVEGPLFEGYEKAIAAVYEAEGKYYCLTGVYRIYQWIDDVHSRLVCLQSRLADLRFYSGTD